MASQTRNASAGALPRWTPYGVTDANADPEWQLAAFAPFPREAWDAPYTERWLAASMVANEPAAWEHVAKGGEAQKCRQRVHNGRRGSEGVTWKPPCRTWTCMDCATQKLVGVLVRAYSLFKSRAVVMVTIMPAHLFSRDAYRRAIGREKLDLDDGALMLPGWKAWGVVLERDGFVFAYSSSWLTPSFAASSEAWDAIDAFEHLRTVALALPGVTRKPSFVGLPRGSHQPRKPSDFVKQAMNLTLPQQDVYQRQREAIAERDHGTSYDKVLSSAPAMTDVIAREAAFLAKQEAPWPGSVRDPPHINPPL